MKRIVETGLILFIAFLIPAGILNAQEKKTGKQVKVIVSDKSGTKVEIDTLIKGQILTDSIKLKNGKVIILSEGNGAGAVKKIGNESGKVIVMVTTDENSKNGEKNEKEKKGDSFVYLIEGKDLKKVGEEAIDVKVTKGKKENKKDKTKIVIAKDGIVVSVKGDDEAKVKELVKDIESKLGVSKDDKDSKNAVREETKKTIKK